MIKFKLIKNTFSVYLDIFNSGLLLISDQFLLPCPIKINFKPSDRIKQEGHRCPKRRVAQAEIRLATAVITFRKEGKKC